MAIVPGAATSNAVTTAVSNPTLTLAAPAGVAVGHLMVASVGFENDGTGTTIATPSGWTKVAEAASSTSGTTAVKIAMYHKVATGGDTPGTTYNWTSTSGSVARAGGGIVAYSGQDATTPGDAAPVTATNVGTVGLAHPGITTATAGAYLVGAVVQDAATTTTITAPTGFTERWQTAGRRTQHADKAQEAAGASGTITWGQNDGAMLEHAAIVWALRPATGAAPATGTGALVAGSPTVTGAGTAAVPQFSGAGGATAAAPTVAGSGTAAAPQFTGSGALVAGSPTLAGSGTAAAPTFTGSGALVAGAPTIAATVAGAGTRTVPTFTGNGALVAGSPTVAGSGGTGIPQFSGGGALVAGAPTVAATGTAGGPARSGAGALVAGSPTVAGSGSAAAAATLTLAPSAIPERSDGQTLTVTGTGFQAGDVVWLDGESRATTYGGATTLTAALLRADVAAARTARVAVARAGTAFRQATLAITTVAPPTPPAPPWLPVGTVAPTTGGAILNEGGGYLLNEAGGRVLSEGGAGGAAGWFLLNETGGYMLNEAGGRVQMEG